MYNKRQRVIIHSSLTRGEYFFSTDHCQEGHSSLYPKNQGFVPTTFHLPMSCAPRPSLPSGRIETVEDLIKIFHSRDKEIPNPDPSFQP